MGIFDWLNRRTTARMSALETRLAVQEELGRSRDTAIAELLSGEKMRNETETDRIRSNLERLLALVDNAERPNVNALWQVARDLPAAHLNIKFFGYELAERLRAALPEKTGVTAQSVHLASKACTQRDMESDWVAYWCSEYKLKRIFHRKLWELCYVNQAIYDHGLIRKGARGLGFGCGQEPIPSYLAAHGVSVVATDVPPDHAKAAAWGKTNQHAGSADPLFKPNLVGRHEFETLVSHRFVDMNAIPADLQDFDFCWSICALEHLGSIANGLRFIENAMETLRPGGVAVHTTEFNFFDDKNNVDNWGTVFFQRKHFLEIKDRLEAKGHAVAPLDFRVGSKPMDRFIDIAPFEHQWGVDARESWAGDQRHLKLEWDGFIVTCFGLIITKAS